MPNDDELDNELIETFHRLWSWMNEALLTSGVERGSDSYRLWKSEWQHLQRLLNAKGIMV